MRINEIVDNHWSAELSLSESLFCASPEHLSKIGSNRVHFVRQDSWLYVWLNKVDNWLIYFLQNNYLEISLAVFYCISTFLGCVHTPLTLVCAEKIAHECERHKEDMFFSSPALVRYFFMLTWAWAEYERIPCHSFEICHEIFLLNDFFVFPDLALIPRVLHSAAECNQIPSRFPCLDQRGNRS